MARDVLIIGASGTGKSTSYRNLNPKETFIINCSKKPLPFRGFSKNYTPFSIETKTGNLLNTDKAASIVKILKWLKSQTQFTTVIVEDANYVMQSEYLAKANEKGYEKFTELGVNFSNIVQAGKNLSDTTLFVMSMHPEVTVDAQGNRVIKAKTVGKLVDQYLTIEGMFTVVCFSKVEVDGSTRDYFFETQTDGVTTAKSPMEMLEFKEPNDLQEIKEKINDYYN